jgi:signal recognition particle subunit SRP54
MFDKLSRTFTDIARNVSGKSAITEKNIDDAVEQIKLALLEADVNLRVVRRFVNATIEEAKGEKVLRSVSPGQMFIKIVYDRMVALLGDTKQDLALKGPDTTSVILLLGLQGSGKTTTAAKLAYRLKKQGRKPLLVAADLVRPAAIEQLRVLGSQIGVPVHIEDSKDPVRVARNGVKRGREELFDTVIVDTTGRMQIDDEMMKQIVEIRDAVKPDESLLVADSMTGQNAVDIAKTFDERVGLSGVILSKFDSDTRGGAALSLKSITGKPIKFVGSGEKPEDLEPFYPDRIASRILGMGDVVSLVEKAQETIDAEEADDLQDKLESSTFDLQDYLDQMKRMKKMGSIGKILEMVPGLAGQVSEDDIDQAQLKHSEAIITSMTMKERRNYHIVGPGRRRRIAKGSGTSVSDVNRLIKQFEKMKLMMKKVSKNKKYQEQLLGGGPGR